MLPTGVITLWYGSIASIPAGWILCNGAGGSPDLRNRFIVGAGDTYAVDANGGNVQHLHNFTGDGHTHNLGAGTDIAAGGNFRIPTDSGNATGATSNASSLPPYYALCFIMKT